MKNGRKTWFRQSTRINTKKIEKLSHERKQKERQNRKVKRAARTQRKIKTSDEWKTSE